MRKKLTMLGLDIYAVNSGSKIFYEIYGATKEWNLDLEDEDKLIKKHV